MNLLNSNLATKQDIISLEGRLKVEIANIKTELLKWMIGAMIAQAGLVVALIKLL